MSSADIPAENSLLKLLDDLAAFNQDGTTVMLSVVPQSSSVISTSWATSTSLLVRYPELAVFKSSIGKSFSRAVC